MERVGRHFCPSCAGIFKHSMGARNRVGRVLSYPPAFLFKSLKIRALAVRRGGPENLDFLGPNGTHFARCYFRAQKSLGFKGPPLPMAFVMDMPASNSSRPPPY